MIINKYNYTPINRTTVEGKRHYALPDGSKVPSVTTILDRTKPAEAREALAKWKKNVQGYNNVVLKNLYEGIDIRYYSDNGSLKYDLIVHPGADISKIKLNYRGVNSLNIKDGELFELLDIKA